LAFLEDDSDEEEENQDEEFDADRAAYMENDQSNNDITNELN
jgi:hypothetical protein